MSDAPKTACILGAGPAGIAAAVAALKKGLKVILIEEKAWVGGKGASRKVDRYIFDFGPHAYHPKSDAVNELIWPHAGADYLKSTVKMDLILKGKHMSYPFNFKEAILKFNPLFSFKILLDYLQVKLENFFSPLPEKSFRDWGLKQFGQTLYDLCFGNYTERVWKVPAGELSVELAKRKLPRFSIRSLLLDLFFRKGKLHSHIFTNELGYHRQGIGRVFENIVGDIEDKGGRILRETTVQNISWNAVTQKMELVLSMNRQAISCDYVISSIPLPDLLKSLENGDSRFAEWTSKLAFRHILLVYVVLDIPRFSSAHWTYLVDDRFNFHRISEQKNLSSACAPEDQTVLTMEISCRAEDPMWGWEPEDFREMVAKDLAFFKIKASRITKIYLSHLEDAYPIYAIDYEKNLQGALGELATIPNLVTTGRQGLFLDIDMHDAMVLGAEAVEALLQGGIAAFYAKNSLGFKQKA